MDYKGRAPTHAQIEDIIRMIDESADWGVAIRILNNFTFLLEW